MKNWEAIEALKEIIQDYEHPDSAYESGVVMGLTYAVTVLENGKDYANQKVDIPRKSCGCNDGKECGC